MHMFGSEYEEFELGMPYYVNFPFSHVGFNFLYNEVN